MTQKSPVRACKIVSSATRGSQFEVTFKECLDSEAMFMVCRMIYVAARASFEELHKNTARFEMPQEGSRLTVELLNEKLGKLDGTDPVLSFNYASSAPMVVLVALNYRAGKLALSRAQRIAGVAVASFANPSSVYQNRMLALFVPLLNMDDKGARDEFEEKVRRAMRFELRCSCA